jgi:Carboxypeptidase regulatory-like domain
MLRRAILALVCAHSILHAQNTGRITGKVIDAATLQPIPKVHVGSNTGGPSGPFVGVLTGSDGSYSLEDVPAGAIQMIVNLNGYKLIAEPAERGESFRLAAGETIRRDFAMHPQGRIYGRLVDRDTGKGIMGHTVSAVHKETGPGRTGYSFNIPRPDGQKGDEFSIAGLDPSDYILQIDSNEEPVFVFPGDAMPKPAPRTCYGQSWYPDVARMDLAVPIHIGEGENRKVEISLHSRETHSISGTLAVPHDWAEQSVTFSLQRNGRIGPMGIMPRPGAYRIDNLTPGSYVLGLTGGKPADALRDLRNYALAEPDGGVQGKPAAKGVGDYAFEVADADIDNFDIALKPYAGVRGEVRMLEKDAKLPPKFAVMLMPASDFLANVMIRAMVVEDGRLLEEGLRPGEYWPRLINLPKGYAVAQVLFEGLSTRNSAIALNGPDSPLTFVLTSRPGTITGVVRNSEQNPAPGVDVVLLPDPFPLKIDPAFIRTQKSAEDGSIAFVDLAPGKYRALVLAEADSDGPGDRDYLRQRAAAAEAIEVEAGQSTRVDLKR